MSDNLFHAVEDMQVILRCKGGVFRQAKVYTRFVDGRKNLFAAVGSGFVMLLGSGGTSSPAVAWIDLDNPQNHAIENGPVGRPYLAQEG